MEALERVGGWRRVYNLEVERDHEYVFGEDDLRAHHSNPTARRVQLGKSARVEIEANQPRNRTGERIDSRARKD